MDDRSFRLGNRAVGNPEGAAGLECEVHGPTLRFDRPAVACLAGADMGATLDGVPVERWAPVAVEPGQTLACGPVTGPGARGYVLLAGGVDVPEHLGSRATFTLGGFGGHAGRALRPGDVLRLGALDAGGPAPAAVPPEERPALADHWDVEVFDGPHADPEFLTPAGAAAFAAATWTVHYNSARTGVRLVGPKPDWARSDGGEAGLHPSNIHDTPYAVGAVDLTGDMPVILGPDGPSLGGFVCPLTVAAGERWKLGQLRAGDTVRFHLHTADDAAKRRGTPAGAIRAGGPPPRGRGRRPAGRHVSPLGRPQPAGRVRRPGARPRPAGAGPSADGAAGGGRVPRGRRPHPGHPLAAGPRGRRAAHGRAGPGARARARRRPARRRRGAHPEPHRPHAAELGRSRDPRGHRRLHAGRPRRRPVVPEQPRVHPPGQRPRRHRCGAPHRFRRVATSSSASATSTWGRRWRPRSTPATAS